MLRDLRVNGAAAPAADFSADVTLETGMAVTKDFATGKAKLVTSATDDNIYFVQKARIPVGYKTAFDDFSDYDEMFNTVAAGEKVVLVSYVYGDAFATSAYASLTSADAGSYVNAGTNGKLTKVASGTSKYLFTGIYDDCGHSLARIEVVG